MDLVVRVPGFGPTVGSGDMTIGPRMGQVIVYLIGCILGRAPCTKETLSDFC